MSASSKETASRLLGSAGLIARLNAELDQDRARVHAEWKAKKLSAKKILLRDLPSAQAATALALVQAEAAKKSFDAAIANVISVRAKEDTIRDAYAAVYEPADAAMLGSYPACIDSLIVELQRLRTATWDGQDRKVFEARQQRLIAAIDEAGRLRINEEVSDVASECARILQSFSGAN